MTKATLLASVGALLLSGATALAGPTPSYGKEPQMAPPPPDVCGPWFSGISGGVWWVQDWDVSFPFILPSDATLEFETGWGINVTPIGYRYNDMLSVSLELGYHEADIEGISLFGGALPFGGTDGRLRVAPAVINFNLNFPVSDALSIYVSGGGGVAYRDAEVTSALLLPGVTFNDSGWNAIAQAKAGVMFEVAPCNFLNVGYRYQHVFGNPDDIQGHMVEVGYTITW